jgi:uridine kinase
MECILLCGPSGAGKSTLATALGAALGATSDVIRQDDAFTQPFLAVELRSDDSYESPEHIDWKDISTLVRASKDRRAGHVVVEGHLVATDASLVALATAFVVVTAHPGVCKARRLERRERTPEETTLLSRYIDEFVTPSRQRYLAPALERLAVTARTRGVPLVRVDTTVAPPIDECVANVLRALFPAPAAPWW